MAIKWWYTIGPFFSVLYLAPGLPSNNNNIGYWLNANSLHVCVCPWGVETVARPAKRCTGQNMTAIQGMVATPQQRQKSG